MIAEGAFWHLDAPVRRLGAIDVPIPFSPPLEDETVPTPDRRRRRRARELCGKDEETTMAIRTYGTMGVDWEERVDFDRLRTRAARAREGSTSKRSELGALLCFDMSNIRYITATHIGTWAIDKQVRFCLLPQDDEPIMWDFGSAARHHKLYSPWLGEERSRAGISTLRGSVEGRAEAVAEKIRVELEQRGLLGEPLGVDIVELPVLRALEAAGHQGRRRPGADAGHPQGQDEGRDHAAEHGVRDGRRRLRRALPGDAARACARTTASRS